MQGKVENTPPEEVETAIVVGEESFENIESLLLKDKELSFVIVFREGFTQFKDNSALSANFGTPKYVAVRMIDEDSHEYFFRGDLWNVKTSVKCLQFFFNTFLFNDVQKCVYDSKGFLNSILPLYGKSEDISESLKLLDPLVGCWLLKSDKPQSTFLGCLNTAGVEHEKLVPGSSKKDCVYQELALLSR